MLRMLCKEFGYISSVWSGWNVRYKNRSGQHWLLGRIVLEPRSNVASYGVKQRPLKCTLPYVGLHNEIEWDAKMKLAQLGPHFTKPMASWDPISQRQPWVEVLFKGTYGWKNQFSLKASKMLQIRSEARTYKWNVKNGWNFLLGQRLPW